MSDVEKKPEHTLNAEQPTEKIVDLPNKVLTDQDAQAVKGGDNYSDSTASIKNSSS